MSQTRSEIADQPTPGRPHESAPERPDQARPERPVYRRSPRALGALVVHALIGIVTVTFVHLLNRTDLGLRDDAAELMGELPATTASLVDSLGITIMVGALVFFAYDQVTRLRYRTMVVTLVSGAIAAGIAVTLAGATGDRWYGDPDWHRAAGLLTAAVGGAGASAIISTRSRPIRWSYLAAGTALVIGGAGATESFVGRIALIALGGVVASIVALITGSPSSQATAAEVQAGLEGMNLRVADLDPHGGDARGSTPWVVQLESGSRVFAKTTTTDERIADLIFRLWRRVYLRDPGDRRPPASLQQSAEHEAFVATRARAIGVRAPRVLGIGALPKGGVVTVHEAIDGADLQTLAGERLTGADVPADHDAGADADDQGAEARLPEAQLREVWSAVAALHRAGIAHRDLRAANVVIDTDDAVWLVDFAVADVLADEAARHQDMAELLCSTAALIGVKEAVDIAVATVGEAVWTEALPMVQPLSVSVATRHALGKSGFEAVRGALADHIQAPEPDLPRLGRLDLRTAATLLALAVATWTLLPQLADSGEVWKQIPDADRTRLALSAAASVVTYIGATIGLRAAIPGALPWFQTLLSQIASSFANRVTPAKVGGVALNVRWMTKQGVSPATATAGVSLNALAGGIIHAAMTVLVVLWAGRTGLGDLETPPAKTIGLGFALVAALVLVGFLIPPLRRTIRYRVWPRTRESWLEMRTIATEPGRIVRLFAGSAIVTLSYIAALSFSTAAVGAGLALSTVALVYLAGSAIASAAPTPGGLGATEATFAAAMTAVGVDQSEAVAAVLLYRLVTYWLPILPGWLVYMAFRRRGTI